MWGQENSGALAHASAPIPYVCLTHSFIMASCSALVNWAIFRSTENSALLLSHAPAPMMPSFLAARRSPCSSCAQLLPQTPASPWPLFSAPPKAASQAPALTPNSSAAWRSSCESCAHCRCQAPSGAQDASSHAPAPLMPRAMAALRSASESCAQLFSQTPSFSLRSASHIPLTSQDASSVKPSVMAAWHSSDESATQSAAQGPEDTCACSSFGAFLAAAGRQDASSKPKALAALRCTPESVIQSRPKTVGSRSSQALAA
mmetsp:Transcript_31028/g.84117  ORF Transcript_31028/g.84117 Transcript_31028/m.84117 type:complete len:260 (-) Transcript_31028:159-938(-)